MAADVVPLQQLKLPSGPSPFTAEQRYWKSFRNQICQTSTAAWAIAHISFPSTASVAPSIAAATKQNDLFAVTSGPRVEIYSIRRREPLKTIGRFDAAARSGEIRSDGKVLVAGDDSGKMQVFDVAGNARAVILKTWHIHKQPVWVTRWAPHSLTTLMSASDDTTVKLWDLPANEPLRSFNGHQDYVRSGAFLYGAGANRNTIVSGSYDSTVRIWDARAPGRAALTFKHAAPIEAVLPLPSGTAVLAAAGNAVSVLDLVAAKPLHTITNHQKTVTSLCLASHGQRVVSGGLDGHVKVFETGAWNVVASTKYPSPVLSLSVITAGVNGDDRHLVVGMQSGVLSIKTRLSGPAAEREKDRKAEVAARDAGTLDHFDAKRAKRKRETDSRQRLEMIGEGVDVVIASEFKRSRKETKWQKDLRQRRFGAALDAVLDPQALDHSPLTVLTLLVALRHRSATRAALENRDEVSVQPILKWIAIHIVDPRYATACVDVGLQLLDLYSGYAGGSTELAKSFRQLGRRVKTEYEKAQMACEIGGMVETLMMSATA